jgi:hypothetical protein
LGGTVEVLGAVDGGTVEVLGAVDGGTVEVDGTVEGGTVDGIVVVGVVSYESQLTMLTAASNSWSGAV